MWVDQYGNENTKTVLLAFQQLSSPLGTVFGYIITFLIKKNYMVKNIKILIFLLFFIIKWYWSVIIQSIGIFICLIILLLVESKYFIADLYKMSEIKNISITLKNFKDKSK